MNLPKARHALSTLLLMLLAAGCNSVDSGKPAVMLKTVSAGEGTPIELQPSAEPFPMGLSVSEGFGLHLFDTPSPNQGFRKMPAESGTKRHFDEFTIAGKA